LENKYVVLSGRILLYNLSSAALQSADKALQNYVFTFQKRWTTISPVGVLYFCVIWPKQNSTDHNQGHLMNWRTVAIQHSV
jgi:hypothetical protein